MSEGQRNAMKVILTAYRVADNKPEEDCSGGYQGRGNRRMSAEDEKRIRAIEIPAKGARLKGDLRIPNEVQGLILFAHGSGSSRLSPRNQYVAGVLQEAGFATLLFDLLTEAEERIDHSTAELR